MSDFKQSQNKCTAKFISRTDPTKHHELPGMFEFFEHAVDGQFPLFWYGILKLACTTDDLKIVDDHQPDDFGVWIVLDDGRRGWAKTTGAGNVHKSGSNLIYALPVVGVTALGVESNLN